MLAGNRSSAIRPSSPGRYASARNFSLHLATSAERNSAHCHETTLLSTFSDAIRLATKESDLPDGIAALDEKPKAGEEAYRRRSGQQSRVIRAQELD